MFAEFKTLYEIHRWLQYITWIGLLSAALFLVWMAGFPPQAWILLLHMVLQLPRAWQTSGPAALFSLLMPLVWSLVWLLGWGFLLWCGWRLIQYHRTHIRSFSHQQMPWVSAQPAPFALSTSGGQTMRDPSLTMTIPMLRLPQKSVPYGGQVTPLTEEEGERAYQTIHDIPTRPAAQPHTSTNAYEKVRNIRPLSMQPQPFQVGVGWNVGLTRRDTPNEDSLLVLQATCTYQGQLIPFGLFAVADGMGGHEHGQEASRLAIQSVMHTVLQNILMGNDLSDAYLSDMLIGGVEWANQMIRQQAQANGKDMGTTLTAALLVGQKAYVVNVGDSRTYLFREGKGLQQITHDHSLVASLVALGQIKPEEIYTHPERNKVYRSLGYSDEVKIDCFTVDLRTHDRLCLCSDGLWEMVRDPMIERVLRSSDDLTFVSDSLVQAALRGGGVDNISAIVVQVPRNQ